MVRRTKDGKPKRRTVLKLSSKIINALNNERYGARTFDGIAKEVNESRSKIILTIKNDPELRNRIKLYPCAL